MMSTIAYRNLSRYVKILLVHSRQQPREHKKKLDYRLRGKYYLFPAQMPVKRELLDATRELLCWSLQGFIAAHGDEV